MIAERKYQSILVPFIKFFQLTELSFCKGTEGGTKYDFAGAAPMLQCIVDLWFI